MNMYYTSSDETSASSSSSDFSWTSDSSYNEDNENDMEMSEPVPKRSRKNNPSDEAYIESESDYNIILKATFKWNIKDSFSKLCKDYKIGEKLESPIYTVGTNEELKWRLQMYPRGNEQNKNYLSVYLLLVSSKEPKVKVEYTCCLLNYKKKDVLDVDGEDYFVQGQRFGFKKWVKTDVICNVLKLHETSRLTIKCDITAHMSKMSANKIKVVNDIKTLSESGNYSDAILEVENKKIKVHKHILAARSPVFAAMFKHNMKESNQNVVEIPDIRYEVMKEILCFIYTGEVVNLDDSTKDLLAAADKYNLEDLKIMCENALCKSLNINNVVEILNFAELHSAFELKEEAFNYVVKNINDVINTPAFVAMEKTHSLLGKLVRLLAAHKSS